MRTKMGALILQSVNPVQQHSRKDVYLIAPIQVQDLALGFVEPDEVCMGPFLELAQVPLNGNFNFDWSLPVQPADFFTPEDISAEFSGLLRFVVLSFWLKGH